MKRSILHWAFGLALVATVSTVSAADIVVNGVNLGQCKSYNDGCNTCSVGPNGQAACTMMYCEKPGTPKCLDEDTSLEDLEKTATGTATKAPEFSVKSFSSCSNMEDVLSDFIADYYKKNPQRHYGYPMLMEDAVMSRSESMAESSKSADASSVSTAPSASPDAGGGGAKDFSQTNVQFGGVDESEIVKTDGSYSYFYNTEDHRVYVTDVRDPKNVSIVKRIKVPESYANPELYLADGKLVLFATKYQELRNPHFYWFDRASKSVVVVYDVRDPANPKIDRFLQID